jgi:uncharacterized membrane protein
MVRARSIVAAAALCCVGLGSATVAQAALIVRAGGAAIYDTETDLTWAADASLHGFDYFVPAGTFVASLSIDGVGGWRLPNMDVDGDSVVCDFCPDNELGYLYGAHGITPASPLPFANVQSDYWSGTQQSGFAYYTFRFATGAVEVKNIQTQLSWTWPVQSGDVFLPEPAEISFTTLGTLPGGTESDGKAVSADGSTVVGTGVSACCEAFRWDEVTGMVGLGDFPGGGVVSYANGTSADGSFVVGSGRVAAPGQDEAYRWDSVSGLVGLGFVPGGSAYSVALDASDDGSKVVGISNAGGLNYVAFLWTSPGPMVSLGDFAGGAVSSIANAISGDGTTVVGKGATATTDLAFVWTAGTGLNPIGPLGGCASSEAYDVSEDGSVVVGWSCEPFIWDAANGIVGLGSLTGSGASFHRAYGVSADGSVVVGRGYESGNTAFIWDARNGMRRIDDLLTAGGVDLDGWTLDTAWSVSADGQTIAGTATKNGNDQAFVAVLPRPDVIDFELAAPGTTIPPDYYEDGFTLRWLGPLGDSQQIVDFAGNNVLVDSNALNFSGAASTLEFTATPGTVFDLISMDVADLTDNPAGGGGVPGAGSRIEIIANGQTFVFLPTSSTFTTETLDLTGLTTLSINIVSAASGADDFAVDDIVLVRRQAAPVPALGILGQLGLALSLAGAGLARARRRSGQRGAGTRKVESS